MSSEISISPSTRALSGEVRLKPDPTLGKADPTIGKPDQTSQGSQALQPWQFFLLAGMLAATAAVVVATGQSMASIVVLSLTVVAASLAGLGAYRTLAPLAGTSAAQGPEVVAGRARAALEREKALALRAIKDLEFDRSMGKIGQADFDEMSARLRSRAVSLMQRLEGSAVHRERIERELAERLAKGSAKSKAAPLPVAVTCASCGTPNDSDARFCKSCGAKLGSKQ